jgi:hypothetical protein
MRHECTNASYIGRCDALTISTRLPPFANLTSWSGNAPNTPVISSSAPDHDTKNIQQGRRHAFDWIFLFGFMDYWPGHVEHDGRLHSRIAGAQHYGFVEPNDPWREFEPSSGTAHFDSASRDLGRREVVPRFLLQIQNFSGLDSRAAGTLVVLVVFDAFAGVQKPR